MFQDRNALWMVALGTLGDAPPNDMQPALEDGIHLRWAFPPARGFPWFGYYLFRRPTLREHATRCIHPWLQRRQAGPLPSAQLPTGVGTLASDRPLVFTEDFPPAGFAEIDLDNRDHVTLLLPAGQPAWRAEVTIGFRSGENAGRRHCVDFRRDQPQVPNPLTLDGASFSAFDHNGKLRPFGRVVALGTSVGWETGFHAQIKLPCLSCRVYVTLSHSAWPAKVEALDAHGRSVASAAMSGNGPETLTLTGSEIAGIRIDAPQDETILLELCWVCLDEEREREGILIRAVLDDVTVASTVVIGAPGYVVQATLMADAFDEVVVGSGDAALIDLCVNGVRDKLISGWERLNGFEYPLSLPVAHPDYPCPGAPATPAAAEARALGRVHYGPPANWAGAPFQQIRGRLERLVVSGPPPGGQAMHQRFDAVAGAPAPPASTGGAITQKAQRPLDLLLLGSLHAPVAEMVGLAWLDKAAMPGVHYDYLLLADHAGTMGGSAALALHWLVTVGDFSVNDGFIAFDKVAEPAAPLPAPTDLNAYSLPGSTVAPTGGGAVIDATNNAGLIWDRKEIADALAADAPIMCHVWRADLVDVDVPAAPADADFVPITKGAPLPVSRPLLLPPALPKRPDDWPPFALHHIDRGRPDGWYAYRVSAIDIFGRHSANSVSARWRQWSPAPMPKPWYYVDPPGNQVINASAIRLLDKIAPPPPPGVEAFALDPLDPTVQHDAAWVAWQSSLSLAEKANVVGLRVRWRWTLEQQHQALDVREFRVYYNPGPVNTLRGRVTSVLDVSATESEVVTDIPNAQPANSFAGLSVRAGAQSFRVLGSAAGTPLRLRVANIGPTDNIRPASRSRCAISLASGHALYKDFSAAPAWQDRMLVVGFAEHVTVEPGGARRYEVLLPVAGSPDRAGLPLVTTLAEPVATGVVGVTAADDKTHTPDYRDEAARFGNESRVGGPATVLRVRRELPPAPPVPPDSARLYASPADYHGHSFFTYRWQPAANLKTFVYRALDDAVFRADLERRPRPPLAAADLQFFPPEAVDPAWDPLKRQQVADELNALNVLDPGNVAAALATYRGLSNDGLRVLVGLDGVDKVFMQITSKPLDPGEPDAAAPDGLRWRRVGPDVVPGSLAAGARAYVDTLDGRATNRWFYRCAYVDEVYNVGPLGLSSPPVWLPNVTPPRAPVIVRIRGGERQIVIEWASNREDDLAEYRICRTDDPAKARDLRLMALVHTVAVAAGDPAARPPTVSWTDQPIPGLVTFFYRLVAVDNAGNASDASPPQSGRAHDQALPVVPVLTVFWTDVGAGVLRAQAGWTGVDETLLQRRQAGGGLWANVGDWRPPGAHTVVDDDSNATQSYEYRLRVRKTTGAAAVGAAVALAAQP